MMDKAEVEKFCEDHLQIDQHRLDFELVEHPVLYNHIASEAALATSCADYMKEELAVSGASVSARLRETAVIEGKKITEAALAAAVLLDKDHQEMHMRYINARELVAIMNAAKESFSTRGYMLRDLCQLYIADYFSKDSVSSPESEGAAAETRRRLLAEKRVKLA